MNLHFHLRHLAQDVHQLVLALPNGSAVATALYLYESYWDAQAQRVLTGYAGLSVAEMNAYLAEFKAEAEFALVSESEEDLVFLQQRILPEKVRAYTQLTVVAKQGSLLVTARREKPLMPLPATGWKVTQRQVSVTLDIRVVGLTGILWRSAAGRIAGEYTARRVNHTLEQFITYCYQAKQLKQEEILATEMPVSGPVRFMVRPWVAGLQRLYAQYAKSKWQETPVYLPIDGWDANRQEVVTDFAGTTATEYNAYLDSLRTEAPRYTGSFYRLVLGKLLPGTKRSVAVVFQYNKREIERKVHSVQFFIQPRHSDRESEVVSGSTLLSVSEDIGWDAKRQVFNGSLEQVIPQNQALQAYFETLLAFGRHAPQLTPAAWRASEGYALRNDETKRELPVTREVGAVSTHSRYSFVLLPAIGSLHRLAVRGERPAGQWWTPVFLPLEAWDPVAQRVVVEYGGISIAAWNAALDTLRTELGALGLQSSHLYASSAAKNCQPAGMRRPLQLVLKQSTSANRYSIRGSILRSQDSLYRSLPVAWFGSLVLVGGVFQPGPGADEANAYLREQAEDLLQLAWHGKAFRQAMLPAVRLPQEVLAVVGNVSLGELLDERETVYVVVGSGVSIPFFNSGDAEQLASQLQQTTSQQQLVCRVEKVVD